MITLAGLKCEKVEMLNFIYKAYFSYRAHLLDF